MTHPISEYKSLDENELFAMTASGMLLLRTTTTTVVVVVGVVGDDDGWRRIIKKIRSRRP